MSDIAGAAAGATPWGAIIQGGTNLIGSLIAAGAAKKQRKQGQKILDRIGEETVPQEILANQNQAKQIAGQGLPQEQYNRAMKNIQRQQLMALRGAGDRRGGLTTLTTIQQNADDALLDLDATDAQQRIRNQQILMNANEDVGNRKQKIWERQYEYGQGLLGAGNTNKTSALDRGAAGLGYLGYGLAGSGLSGGRKRFEPMSGGFNPMEDGPVMDRIERPRVI